MLDIRRYLPSRDNERTQLRPPIAGSIRAGRRRVGADLDRAAYCWPMWVLLLAIFVIVAALMILNARSRRRLERMGGDPGDPTRRFPWMRSGG